MGEHALQPPQPNATVVRTLPELEAVPAGEETTAAPVGETIATGANEAERRLHQVLHPSPTAATLVLQTDLGVPADVSASNEHATVGTYTVVRQIASEPEPEEIIVDAPTPGLTGTVAGQIEDSNVPAPTPGMSYTVVPEAQGSSVVDQREEERIWAELKTVCAQTHDGYLAYGTAIRKYERTNLTEDKKAITEAARRFAAGINMIEAILELRSMNLDVALDSAKRIDLICRVAFGRGAEDVDEGTIKSLTDLQDMESPEGEFASPLAKFKDQIGTMKELICTPDFCFSTEVFYSMLYDILRVDWWGTRNAQATVASAAYDAGYPAAGIQLLGRGGMSTVVHALPLDPKKQSLAIKYPVTAADVAMSKRAALADVGPGCAEKKGHQTMLLMMFENDALPLENILKEGSESGEKPVFDYELMTDIAAQTAAMHAAGIVHRDMKPGNVLVRPRGDGQFDATGNRKPRAIIIDYGMAADMPTEEFAPDEVEGAMRGTPPYMPKENLATGSWGPGRDVYALGCIAFEMATGKSWSMHIQEVTNVPGSRGTTLCIVDAHSKLTEELFQQALLKVEDERLRGILAQLLHPESDNRIRTAEEAHNMFLRLQEMRKPTYGD